MLLDTSYGHVSCQDKNQEHEKYATHIATFMTTETPRYHNIRAKVLTSEHYSEITDRFTREYKEEDFYIPLPYVNYMVKTYFINRYSYEVGKWIEGDRLSVSINSVFMNNRPFDPACDRSLQLSPSFMPNSYKNGQVCTNLEIDGGDIFQLINAFHSSVYNADLYHYTSHFIYNGTGVRATDSIFKTLEYLESLSLEEMMDQDWDGAGMMDPHFNPSYCRDEEGFDACGKEWTPLPTSDIIFDDISQSH